MAYTPGYAKDDIKLKGKKVVSSNAEKMSMAELIKIAQSNGNPLFKLDEDPEHDSRANR